MTKANEQAIRGLANEILMVTKKWLKGEKWLKGDIETRTMMLIAHDAKAIIERLGPEE